MADPRRALILALLLTGVGSSAAAQRVSVGDPLEDYARVLSLLDSIPDPSFTVRPLSDGAWRAVLADGNGPWAPFTAGFGASGFGATPFTLRTTFNSAFPSGQNDGLMWQGKGVSSILEGGVTWRRGRFEATLRPQYAWSANADFELAPNLSTTVSKYANAWRPGDGRGGRIDLPQRMGPDDYSELSWGESSLRFHFGGWAAGVSNEQMWWGPAQRNPIILSNTAPGFRHGMLGTTRPVKIPGGRAELRWIWGSLRNSGWTDTIPNDRTRYLTAIVAALHPGFIPGLSVGATRAFQMNAPPGGIATGDIFLVFQGITKNTQASDSNPEGNDLRDQLLSLFARYTPPGSGFEAYFEWGRNDHSWDIRDFLMEPEHTAATTLGVQQVVRLPDARILRVAAEWTNLQQGLTKLVRPAGSWYTHGVVRDGWTARGQMLGAGIGPGSTSQALWGDLFTKWGKGGILLQRVARDNDIVYIYFPGDPYDRQRHQIELTARVSALVHWRGLEVEGALGIERHLNRHYQFENDVTNIHLELGARSRIPPWR